jgi:hypothetical protein
VSEKNGTDYSRRAIGKKVVRLLVVTATLHMEACAMFIKLVNQLLVLNKEWHYAAVLGLGMVAIDSQYPNIRRFVMERGLIPLTEFGQGLDKSIENSWIVRFAALTALAEVYQLSQSDPVGILAREVLQERKKVEQNLFVKNLLEESKCNVVQNSFLKRLSFLPKYIGISLAEFHLDIQSDYKYMKKYLQASEQVEKRRNYLKQKKKDRIIVAMEHEAIKKLALKGIILEPEYTEPQHVPPIPQISIPSAPKVQQYWNIEDNILSTQPYHTNYKDISIIEDNKEKGQGKNLVSQKLPRIGPSLIGTNAAKQDSITLQSIGTANRRKLFDHEKSSCRSIRN